MSKLLLDEQPLMILPQLAVKIGLNEAIVLQQVHYWLLQKKSLRDGRYWVYNTYEKWRENFPFWSVATIKRTLTALREPYIPGDGDLQITRPALLIATSKYNAKKYDKTLWYTIDYEALDSIENPQVKMTQGSKCADASGQNDPMDEVKMTQPIPETSTEITPETTEDTPIFPEKALAVESIIAQAQTHPDQFDLGRRTEAARSASGNYAIPARAGGGDGLADLALSKLYEFSGSEAPAEGKERDRQRDKVAEVLKAYKCAGVDPAVIEEAARLHCAAKGEFVNVYYTSFPADFGKYLGQARALHKKKDDRRAQTVEANEEARAAVAARASPAVVKDCAIGAQVKRELAMQMDKGTYNGYVAPTRMVVDDGTLRVIAPDAFTRDWIENRLGLTVRRILAGMGGQAVEFEVGR